MLIPFQAEEENLAAKTAIRTQHKELESWYPGDQRSHGGSRKIHPADRSDRWYDGFLESCTSIASIATG